MKHDTEADVRTDTAIKVAALFFAAMMFLAFTTDPIRTGTQEGDRAPALTGMAYNGSGWANFEMSDYLTTNWTAGDAAKVITYNVHNGLDMWRKLYHDQLPKVEQ